MEYITMHDFSFPTGRIIQTEKHTSQNMETVLKIQVKTLKVLQIFAILTLNYDLYRAYVKMQQNSNT